MTGTATTQVIDHGYHNDWPMVMSSPWSFFASMGLLLLLIIVVFQFLIFRRLGRLRR